MIAEPLEEIDRRARLWAETLGVSAQVIEGESMVGGGSLPGSTLPTRLVAIRSSRGKGANFAQKLAYRLRTNKKFSVIGRISDDVLLLDPRSVLPEEDEIVLQALRDLNDI
jgi:L-seryl-tRNA(Ser) seleniumtransferase